MSSIAIEVGSPVRQISSLHALDFSALHENLLSQPSSEMGFIPKHLLPHLPSKKITPYRYTCCLKSLHCDNIYRSLKAVTVEKRKQKLGRYLSELVLLPQCQSNYHGEECVSSNLCIMCSASFVFFGHAQHISLRQC